MELVSADIVQARQGEAAFILQLRPPAIGNADELAQALEAFTGRYLATASGDEVRFAPLGALTWALSAPLYQIEAVDLACDGLAEALFGNPSSQAVHLVRQPDAPVYGADASGEADDEEPGWTQSDPDEELAGWEASETAEQVSAGDQPEAVAESFERPDGDGDDAGKAEAPEADAADSDWDFAAPELDSVTLEAETGQEPDVESLPGEAARDDDDMSVEADDDWALAETVDESIDIEGITALDASTLGEPVSVTEAGGNVSAFDALDLDLSEAETCEAESEAAPLDLAAEMAAFRQEMAQIAQSIPQSAGDVGLSEFRAELENLTGALGQRVDGAAQRIESAVDRVDPDRFVAASDRVEQAASLIESSVQSALDMLNTANQAMSRASSEAEDDGNVTVSG